MNTKFWLSVLTLAIVSFFGGWLFFGMLLGAYYESSTTEAALSIRRAEQDMIWWAMILAQIVWAFTITWVVRETNNMSVKKGAMAGGIISALFATSFDLFMHTMMDIYASSTFIMVDVLSNAIFGALLGAIAGWILSRNIS